jgi:hypothetical protein
MVMVAVPSPSFTTKFEVVNCTVPGVSSLFSVPTPCESVIVAFEAPVRFRRKSSFGSTVKSPRMLMVICFEVSPGLKVKTPPETLT